MVRMEEAKNWALRLEKEFHFEEFEGFREVDYQLLFYRGRNILVSAVDAARAATYGAGSGSKIEYTAAEIVGTLDVREIIDVPGPEISASLKGAVEGTYIPLESLCAILHGSILADDISEFSNLLNEFRHNQDRQQEYWLREKRLRRSRLEESLYKGEQLRRTKLREERSRKAKLRREALRSQERSA